MAAGTFGSTFLLLTNAKRLGLPIWSAPRVEVLGQRRPARLRDEGRPPPRRVDRPGDHLGDAPARQGRHAGPRRHRRLHRGRRLPGLRRLAGGVQPSRRRREAGSGVRRQAAVGGPAGAQGQRSVPRHRPDARLGPAVVDVGAAARHGPRRARRPPVPGREGLARLRLARRHLQGLPRQPPHGHEGHRREARRPLPGEPAHVAVQAAHHRPPARRLPDGHQRRAGRGRQLRPGARRRGPVRGRRLRDAGARSGPTPRSPSPPSPSGSAPRS